MDSEPLVALTGQVPTDLVGNDAFQETDTIGVTTPVTKSNYFASSSDTVGEDVSTAFALAEHGRQGPTLVDLPKDVTLGETEAEPTEPSVPDTVSVREHASDEDVAAAAETIADADRPIILAGGGVVKGEATDEVRAFATEHEIPVVTTMPGIGAFPEDHDLAMEMAGMHGTGYANMAVTMTDCMLAVGTRFDDRLTGGVDSFAPDAELVHVDIDPAEISKNIEADHPLVGDASTVIEQLADALPASPDTDEWVAQCAEWKTEYSMDYGVHEDGPVKPQYVVETVDAATDDDTVVTTGVGQHQMWACQYWTYTQPRTWISSHGLGTMGYGLPAAIGARVAADDDQSVVCFDGDGSFMMTCQELVVAVREQLDITVFVLNNEAIGMVRQWQDAFFEGRRMARSTPGCRSSTSSPRRSAPPASASRSTTTCRTPSRRRSPSTARPSWTSTSTPRRTSTRWFPRAATTASSRSRRTSYERATGPAGPARAGPGGPPATRGPPERPGHPHRPGGGGRTPATTHRHLRARRARAGVLARVSGLFSRRQFNIESLTVADTQNDDWARITVVVEEPDPGIDQVEKQLEKVVPVIHVRELEADAVTRELVVVKVDADRPNEVHAITEMYSGKTLDAGPRTITVELTGDEQKIDDAIDAFRQFGIREIARTGRRRWRVVRPRQQSFQITLNDRLRFHAASVPRIGRRPTLHRRQDRRRTRLR